MTVSEHVYAATVAGQPLSVKGGQLSLDSSRAPHVECRLEVGLPGTWATGADDGPVWTPAPATYALLDPRTTPTPRVMVTAVKDAGVTRVFDLHVRDRSVDHRTGTVTLRLASDEALADDYGPLVDDTTPLAFQGSLHSLVGYVLATAISGAILEAGGPDPAIRALADSQNLIRNSRAGNNITDWGVTWNSGGVQIARYPTGGPSYAPTCVQVYANVAASTGVYVYIDDATVRVTAGRRYLVAVSANPPAGKTITVDAILYDAAGNIVGFTPPTTIVGNGSWQRAVLDFYAIGNAARIRPRVNIGAMAYGSYFWITAWRVSEFSGDPADTDYYDGDTTDTTEYDYSWADAAHASLAVRRTLVDAPTPDALIWKAGQSAMDFLHPLVQANGLRMVCDEARVWTLRAATYAAPGSTVVRAGVNMVEGAETISRDAGIWFDARAVIYAWTDPNGVQQRRVDAYALTDPHTRMTTLELSTAYAGPGRARYAVERAQGVGREVTVSAVSNWETTPEQPVSITLPDTPPLIGTVQSVQFDLSTDEMTVAARTVELGAHSIAALTGTINALTGTINNL